MDTTIVLVIVGVLAALGVGVFLFLRGKPQHEEAYSHFRCPKCRRRLRYISRQVGRKGKCSNCGGDVLFPPLSQSID